MNRLASSVFKSSLGGSSRFLSTSNRCNIKVSVLGAMGGIGAPLSLMLKHSPYIQSLALYDVKDVQGQAMDLSHIDTSSTVYGFTGEENLHACLDGAEVVVMCAGIPRKPGMTRGDLFKVNAGIIMSFSDAIVKATHNPFICIITNPVNSLVPVCAEVLRKNGVFDTRKLFGVSTLDTVRASTFYAELTGKHPSEVHVPVVGGHSGKSIVPLFSVAEPKVGDPSLYQPLVDKVRNAGTEVVNAKKGDGSATLSMAYSGARFVSSILQAMLGKLDIVECAYTHTKNHPEVDFFADLVRLDAEGHYGVIDLHTISDEEKAMIAQAKAILKEEIKLGKDFVEKNYKAPNPEKAYELIHGKGSPKSFSDIFYVPDWTADKRLNRRQPQSKLGEGKIPKRKELLFERKTST